MNVMKVPLLAVSMALAAFCLPASSEAQLQASPSLKDIQGTSSGTSPQITGGGDRQSVDLSNNGKYDAGKVSAYRRAADAADRQHLTGPARDIFIKSQLQSYAITGR